MTLPRLDALKFLNFGAPKSPAKSTKRAPAARNAKRGFQAVSIATGWPSCAAARELEGQRFLAKDAPHLPLPGCDQTSCDCAYQRYADRRDGPRRDAELGLRGTGFRPVEEQRHSSDRRTENRLLGAEPAKNYFEHATGHAQAAAAQRRR